MRRVSLMAAGYAASFLLATPILADDPRLVVANVFSTLSVASDSNNIAVPNGSYTRLVVENTHAPDLATTYPYRKRRLLFRIALSKDYVNTAILRAQVGTFNQLVTLLDWDHDSSSSNGETFARLDVAGAYSFPLLLVSSTNNADIADFEFQVFASDANHSSLASLALGVARKVSEAAAPQAGVVTTLASDRMDRVSAAVDGAINSVFNSSIKETTRQSLRVGDDRSLILEVFLPCPEGNWNTRNDAKNQPAGAGCASNRVSIGKWTIGFEAPRASLFSDIKFNPAIPATGTKECRAATAGAKPPCGLEDSKAVLIPEVKAHPYQVLAYKLVDAGGQLGTVRGYLANQSWWGDALGKTVEDGKVQDSAIASLCQRVAGSMSAIGLSDLDGKLIAYSVVHSDLVDPLVISAVGGQSSVLSKTACDLT